MPNRKDYITALNNHFQGPKAPKTKPSFKESEGGPANDVTWTVECKVGDRIVGVGASRQKQAAKEEAARLACQELGIPA